LVAFFGGVCIHFLPADFDIRQLVMISQNEIQSIEIMRDLQSAVRKKEEKMIASFTLYEIQ
jgi:hypothetical protein